MKTLTKTENGDHLPSELFLLKYVGCNAEAQLLHPFLSITTANPVFNECLLTNYMQPAGNQINHFRGFGAAPSLQPISSTESQLPPAIIAIQVWMVFCLASDGFIMSWNYVHMTSCEKPHYGRVHRLELSCCLAGGSMITFKCKSKIFQYEEYFHASLLLELVNLGTKKIKLLTTPWGKQINRFCQYILQSARDCVELTV